MSIKDIREGWINYIRSIVSKRNLSPEFQEMVERRINICSVCPELNITMRTSIIPGATRCKKCGCVFPAMVYARGKRCPIGKWPAED